MCNFEVIVRYDNLHFYADGVHVVVGDVIAKKGNENGVVLLNAWGPRATSVTALDSTRIGWRNFFKGND